MKRKSLTGLVVGLFLITMTGVANATLIGDTVVMSHSYGVGIDNPLYGDPKNVLVTIADEHVRVPINDTPDPNDSTKLAIYYYVDFGSNFINVDFASYTGTFDPAPNFNGLVVKSINDDSGNPLTSVLINTNLGGWNDTRLLLTGDSVAFNWKGLTKNPPNQQTDDPNDQIQTFFYVTLGFSANPVPEPTTMLLLGFGLVGLAGLRRKLHK